MIPAQRTSKFPNANMAASSFLGLMTPTTNSIVTIEGVLNPIPLQTLPPPMAITYPQYTPYQPQPSVLQEFSIVSIPKESNETLLLNLTKKLEELVVYMAKEKEKRPKQTNFRANIWYNNYKGHGHMAQDCPSPPNMKLICNNCEEKHYTYSC